MKHIQITLSALPQFIADISDIAGEEKLTIAAWVRDVRQGTDVHQYVLTNEHRAD